MSIKKAIRAWENISKKYSKLIVPNHPSQDDCRIYGILARESLQNKKQPKIMVMGSTPELRRILYAAEFLQKAEIFCVDINSSMYKAMGNFLMEGNFNERFIKRSWLDTKFKEKTFDLVIGDEVICNVPSDKHDDLFREIKRILKKDGAWITRHNFYIKEDEKSGVKKILNDIAVKIANGAVDFQYGINIINVKIFYYLGWADHLNNSIANCFRIIKKECNQSFKNHKLEKIIKELVNLHEKNFVPLSGEYKWYVLSSKKSKDELKGFFVIAKEIYAKDYITVKNSPIYLLLKK